MPRGYRHLQVSFAGGEMSPEMWSRHDDARFRNGAGRLLNFISNPRGAASRRPGFALVREAKDSTRAVRLFSFRYSQDQTLVLEMSRATVDARDIGYIRFHTQGATLLQPRPDNYRTHKTASAINFGTDEWTVGAHDFQTGDPIVFTMEATTEVVTFDTATNEVVTTTSPHNYQIDAAVLFRSSSALPAEIEAGRIYYILATPAPTATRFAIAAKRGGQQITFATAGSGTHKVACMPNPMSEFIDVNKTYYAINRSGTTIAIAGTKADAIANNAFNYVTPSDGSVPDLDINIHYDYRNGSVVIHTVGGQDRPFYCRKAPWGTPGSPIVYIDDHNDHPPTNLIYWVGQPGFSSTVTFTAGTDVVNWATHPLSNGDPITFTTTGSLAGTGITAGQVYYVRNAAAGTFQLSESLPGPILDILGAGTGTHTAFGNGIYEVPHDYAESALFEINTTQSGDVLTLVHQDRNVAELRRLGAAYWVLAGVAFNSAIVAPGGVEVTTFGGLGLGVTGVTAASPAVLTTASAHQFALGEKVMVQDLSSDISDGHYIVNSSTTPTLTLKTFESGALVNSAVGGVGAVPRIRPSGYAEDWLETYVVTALLENDEESPPGVETTAVNNLLVDGAYNTIAWDPVSNAERYRVYRSVDGLFGFIGETTAPTTTFTDDNIAPDLSITPPLPDNSLSVSAFVTFNSTTDVVNWTAHGLEAGAPVLFDTNNALPSGLTYGVTYYVLNPMDDTFQLATSPTSETAVVLGSAGSGVHVGVSGFWPSSVCYFEGRRVFGGARLRPQDFWMTASGTERSLRYHIPILASDRIQGRIAGRQRAEIRHAIPASHLLLLTDTAEYRITPLNDDSLTPGSIAARAPTHIGTSTVAPVLVNNVVLYPASRGGHVRELAFQDGIWDYLTGNVSLRAAHLFDNFSIVEMDHSQAPYSVVWAVSSTGSLLGFTYIPEEQVAGWHEHTIDGTVESVAVVSEGMEDRVYIVAKRGSTRFVERMGSQYVDAIADCFYVDNGITYDGAAVSSLYVPHLAGGSVVYLADGIPGTGTVSAGGVLTLATAASTVHVGVAYTSDLQTIPLGMQVDAAFGTGRTKNINELWARVYRSGAFQVGPVAGALSDSPAPTAGTLLTQLVQITPYGDWNDEGQVWLRQASPLPLIVAGLTLEVASGG